jgi:hypothetical protein
MMQKNLKLSFDGGISGSKKYKWGYGHTYGGICIWWASGVRRLVCIGVWQESGFSKSKDIFKFDLVYKDSS